MVLDMQLPRGFGISGQVAWLCAVAARSGEPALDAKQLQNIPRLRGNVAASYRMATPQPLLVELRLFGVGRRSARADGVVSAPGYVRADLGLDLRASKQLEFRLAVENLANRRYWRDVGQAYSADLLFPGRPRTLFLGLTISG